MSKSNNKGLSLIDVIIAVAVLSILISPIIGQIITTVDTSSRAKERQYVIDDADKVMDYFRSNSIKELTEYGSSADYLDKDSGEAITIKSVNKSDCTAMAMVYDNVASSKTEVPNHGSGVDYEVTDFELGTFDKVSNSTSPYIVLGKEKNRYTRTVSLDDLNNNVLSYGYRIIYDFNKPDYATSKQKLIDAGYEITTEGSAVQYDSNGHVSKIVCLDTGNTSYVNPNTATPIITDIDSQKMAIIQGDASTVDNQFQNDFIGNMMSIVQKKKKKLESIKLANGQTQYEYYMDRDNLNEAFDSARESNDFYRLIKLTVKVDGLDAKNLPTKYRVKCEVFYKAQYTFLDESFGTDTDNEKFRYTVFDQTFNTSEPPDVLFIYEPFVKKTDDIVYSYADTDYIFISSDSYTSGTKVITDTDDESGKTFTYTFDPSKVYLIKADSSWAEEVVNKANLSGTQYDDGVDRSISEDKKRNDTDSTGQHYYNYFYRTSGGRNIPVSLNINQITDDLDSTAKPLQIVTNITWRPNDDDAYSFGGTSDDNPLLNKAVTVDGVEYRQYDLSKHINDTKMPNPGLSSTEELAAYPSRADRNRIGIIEYPDDTKFEKRDSIICPTLDTVEYGRLYSMTVRYHNEDRETEQNVYTYFTGAKGAD